MRAILAENRARPFAPGEERSLSRSLAVLLALGCAGCILLGRESYTTLTGVGATPVPAPARVSIGRDRSGPGFAQDPVAVRAGVAPEDVLVAVCDWDPGFWIPVFPPLPIPILSSGEQPGIPQTTVVRVTFLGAASWRATFADLALVDPGGARARPFRYRIVLPAKSESLAAEPGALEPCVRAEEPRRKAEKDEVAVLEKGELWLEFDTRALAEGRRALVLDGITRDGAKVPLPRLELVPGSRWFWYRIFP